MSANLGAVWFDVLLGEMGLCRRCRLKRVQGRLGFLSLSRLCEDARSAMHDLTPPAPGWGRISLALSELASECPRSEIGVAAFQPAMPGDACGAILRARNMPWGMNLSG